MTWFIWLIRLIWLLCFIRLGWFTQMNKTNQTEETDPIGLLAWRTYKHPATANVPPFEVHPDPLVCIKPHMSPSRKYTGQARSAYDQEQPVWLQGICATDTIHLLFLSQ